LPKYGAGVCVFVNYNSSVWKGCSMSSNSVFRFFVCLALISGFVLLTPVLSQEEVNKTKAQVDEAIQAAGSEKPDWWESVNMDYPETLDMSWPVRQNTMGGRGRRGGGRRGGQGGQSGDQASTTNVDDYLSQVVYTDPSKYKAGIKLVDHLMNLHKEDGEKLQRSQNTLGNMFYQLIGDYARAAFWWQKCSESGGTVDPLKMAHCYAELGSKSAAQEMLLQVDENAARNNKDLIKMWAQIGELDRALEMVESFSGGGRGGMNQNDKYLFSGELCRGAGQYDKAIGFYEQLIASSDSGAPARGGRGGRSIETRAANNLAAVKLMKNLDISKIPDGSYTAEALSYGGPLTVKVECKSGRIVSVEVVQNTDTPNYFARGRMTTNNIIKNKSFKGVVAVTGATISSDAIIYAAVQALSQTVEE